MRKGVVVPLTHSERHILASWTRIQQSRPGLDPAVAAVLAAGAASDFAAYQAGRMVEAAEAVVNELKYQNDRLMVLPEDGGVGDVLEG